MEVEIDNIVVLDKKDEADIDRILSNPIDFIDRTFELQKSKDVKNFNPIKAYGSAFFKEIINSSKIKNLEDELKEIKKINTKEENSKQMENEGINEDIFVKLVNFTYVVTNTLNSDLYISHIEGDPFVDNSGKLKYAMLKYKSTNLSDIKEDILNNLYGREDGKVTILERLELNVKPFSQIQIQDSNQENNENFDFTVYEYDKSSLKLNQIVKSIGIAYFMNNSVYFHSLYSQEVKVNNVFLSLLELETSETTSETLSENINNSETSEIENTTDTSLNLAFLSKNRSMVKRFLSSKLLGDKIEYDNNLSECLILGIASEIFARVSDVNIGNFTLNLTGFKKSDYIVELLKEYVPYVCVYKLTVNNLNNDNLIPTFNPDTEKLSHSPITYLEGGLVILDETNLDNGKLTENGMRNFSYLTKTIESQLLTLDYPYNSGVDIPISSSFIIISEAGSLIAKALKSVKTINVKEIKTLSDNNLFEVIDLEPEIVKTYFKLLKLYTHPKFTKKFEISDEVSLKLQEYFVQQRKEKNFESEEFSLLINLAKLRAISFGRNKLDFDLDFKYVINL